MYNCPYVGTWFSPVMVVQRLGSFAAVTNVCACQVRPLHVVLRPTKWDRACTACVCHICAVHLPCVSVHHACTLCVLCARLNL